MSGVNANRPIPMATASDKVPDTAITSGWVSPPVSVAGVIRQDGAAVGIGTSFLAGACTAESHTRWRMSERRIGRTLAAASDQIKALVAFEIEPLLELAISAIEREMLSGDHQSVTFEQCRAADFEQIILHV